MGPEDLTAEIHCLDAVVNRYTGRDRLEKQARLIRLKAQLASRRGSDLAARLQQLDQCTRDCLQADVRRATADRDPCDVGSDRAFERAMSTIEGLVATHH
jgi:hypothetical protein